MFNVFKAKSKILSVLMTICCSDEALGKWALTATYILDSMFILIVHVAITTRAKFVASVSPHPFISSKIKK